MKLSSIKIGKTSRTDFEGKSKSCFGCAELKLLHPDGDVKEVFGDRSCEIGERSRGEVLKLFLIHVQMLFKAMNLDMITKIVSVDKDRKNIKDCAPWNYSVLCVFIIILSSFYLKVITQCKLQREN